MHSLPLFVRLQGRKVILVGDGEAADAKRRLLERAGANVVGVDDDASLAIVALEKGAEDVVVGLKARGVLVNAVDRPELCDFTLPSIVDRDPVLIAVGTGGASAGLAKALRQRLEDMLPSSLGRLALAFRDNRPSMKARWPGPAERRRAIDAALAPNGPLDPLQEGAADDFHNWLEGEDQSATNGYHILRITSDDPDDLTIRQARLLGSADCIYHAPGIASAILNRARADADRVESSAQPEPPFEGIILWLERG